MIHHIIKKSSWKLCVGTCYTSFCGGNNGLFLSRKEASKLPPDSRFVCPNCRAKMEGKKK